MMLQISENQESRLNELARQAGKPVDKFIDMLLNEYLLDRQDTNDAYTQFLASGEKSIPLDEVIKQNEL